MMNFEQIINEIKELAKSQGFYGRKLARIQEIETENPEMFEQLKCDLEKKGFETTLDLILYLEEGKHCKKPEKKIWKVPVTWKMYGWVDVEADTPEDAIKKWEEKEASDEPFDLPTDAEYVDGSFELYDSDLVMYTERNTDGRK